MKSSNKEIYLKLALFFGFLIGAIMLLIGFIPQRDLKDYQRLSDGEGQTVEAVSTGGTGRAVSGKRGGSTEYCTSWRYELDDKEKYFTDRQDCYSSAEEAPAGTTAELIYDPNDTSTMFVKSDNTENALKGTENIMRIISIFGGLILAASVATVLYLKRKPTQNKDTNISK